MGKGFNNYMCKKFFHPASRDNLKRVWMAEQKTAAEKAKQDDLRNQYDREQELYNNKALLSKESKDKLGLNFMYEPPPGHRKPGELRDEDKDGEEGGEPEYKFEWQRKWGTAPRESWAKGDEDIKDQPFGIQVRNVRCVKCHKYGHINTEKVCPMFGKAADAEAPVEKVNQQKLLDEMREDGMKLRWTAWEIKDDPRLRKYDNVHPEAASHEAGPSSRKDPDNMLEGMSKEEKLRLLKKLEKMEKKKKKKAKKEAKKSKKDKKKSKKASSESSDEEDGDSGRGRSKRASSETSSSEDEDRGRKGKKNGGHTTRRRDSSPGEKKRSLKDRSTSRDKDRKRSVSPKRRDRSNSPATRRNHSNTPPRRRNCSNTPPKRRDRSNSPKRREHSPHASRRRDLSAEDKKRSRKDRSTSRDRDRKRSVSPKRRDRSRSPKRRERSNSPQRRRDRSRSTERRRR